MKADHANSVLARIVAYWPSPDLGDEEAVGFVGILTAERLADDEPGLEVGEVLDVLKRRSFAGEQWRPRPGELVAAVRTERRQRKSIEKTRRALPESWTDEDHVVSLAGIAACKPRTRGGQGPGRGGAAGHGGRTMTTGGRGPALTRAFYDPSIGLRAKSGKSRTGEGAQSRGATRVNQAAEPTIPAARGGPPDSSRCPLEMALMPEATPIELIGRLLMSTGYLTPAGEEFLQAWAADVLVVGLADEATTRLAALWEDADRVNDVMSEDSLTVDEAAAAVAFARRLSPPERPVVTWREIDYPEPSDMIGKLLLDGEFLTRTGIYVVTEWLGDILDHLIASGQLTDGP